MMNISIIAYAMYVAGAVTMLAVGAGGSLSYYVYVGFGLVLTMIASVFGKQSERYRKALFRLRVNTAAAKQKLDDVTVDVVRQTVHVGVVRQIDEKTSETIPVELELLVFNDAFCLVVKAAPEAEPATMEQIRGLAKAV